MPIRYITFLSTLILLACSSQPKKPAEDELISEEIIEKLPEIKGTLFELASRDDLSDPCTFLLECDCCVGDLLLREDGSFFHIEYCVQERYLYTGTYNMQGDLLSLKYTQTMASELVEWEDENGEEVQVTRYEANEIEPQTTRFKVSLCKDKLRLDDESQTFVGLQVLHEGGKVLFGSIDKDSLVRFLKSEQRKP
jgi:hypothetical protein